MIAQQDAVDTISNNLSNVNTVGYKKETVEFKTLLYSKLQTKTTDSRIGKLHPQDTKTQNQEQLLGIPSQRNNTTHTRPFV